MGSKYVLRLISQFHCTHSEDISQSHCTHSDYVLKTFCDVTMLFVMGTSWSHAFPCNNGGVGVKVLDTRDVIYDRSNVGLIKHNSLLHDLTYYCHLSEHTQWPMVELHTETQLTFDKVLHMINNARN